MVGYALGLISPAALVSKIKKDTAMRITVVLTVILVLILIGYVWVISLDIFTAIEQAGIDTSGRVDMFKKRYGM